jgi:RimJ/RimL family protein N-acetyltransferase
MPLLTPDVVAAETFSGATQPTIPTRRGLVLRPWTPRDAPAVFEAFADPEIRRWHVRTAASRDEVEGWINSWAADWPGGTEAHWAIADSVTDDLLGRVSLKKIRPPITPAPPTPEHGTSQISIVDAQGNAAALTTTVESAFGSFHMVDGFILNNQPTDTVYLYSLWLDPAARGHGLARPLVVAAVDWARGQQARTVKLRVAAGNAVARGVYESLGFTVAGAETVGPREEVAMSLSVT